MGLSFLSPLLLAGTALVAVPIVLHMVMRQKPVPHDFPALRFLRQRSVVNRRRLRLTHLLLLAMRVAALLLLAGALARPVVRGAGWLADREGPVAAAFVFDTAPRMLLRAANRTRIEQATALADVLFTKLPATSRVAVIDTSDGAAAFAPSLPAARARVERLAAAPQAVALPAAVAEALRLLGESDLARRELYVFTDCSHGAWDGAAAIDPAAMPAGTSVLYVDVSADAPQNVGIEEITLSNDRIPAGTQLAVSVAATRTGPEVTRQIALEMRNPDGTYTRRAVKPVSWKAPGTLPVEFDIGGMEPGTRQGRVLLEGADDLEADDVRSFTVEVGSATKVIVAAAAPAARTAGFLIQAIAPKALLKTGKSRFEPVVVDIDKLDGMNWSEASGMVLVDPPPLPPRTWDLLGQWVAAGRGLVIWLGPRAGGPETFNSDAAAAVLGGRIVRVWRSPGADNYLAPTALEHPLLAAFRRVGDAVPWQDFPVTRHWEFELSDPPADGDGTTAGVVARYRNGLPAIVDHRVGQGTVVTVTTPVSTAADDPDAWNTLATGFEPWPFLILANESLVHALDTGDSRNIVAGSPAVLHLDRRDVAAAFVRTPQGDEFPAAVDQKRGTVTVTATDVPGNYQVRTGGQAAGTKGFSANLAAAAVDFSRVPEAELATLFGPDHRLARTEEQLVRDVNLERIGAELFGWLVILAAGMMAADWILANRFYAPRDPQAGPGAAETFAAEAADAEVADVSSPAAPPPIVPPPVPPPVPEAVS